MKFGMRKPSLKKIFKVIITGRLKTQNKIVNQSVI